MKNIYGLPKVMETPFKNTNIQEAKKSMLRDHKRDTRTMLQDNQYFDVMIRDKRLKNQTPTLQTLNLGKLQGVQTNINQPGYMNKNSTIHHSPRKVDFDLQSEKNTKEEIDERKLKMDPSSAVIDYNKNQNFNGEDLENLDTYMSP